MNLGDPCVWVVTSNPEVENLCSRESRVSDSYLLMEVLGLQMIMIMPSFAWVLQIQTQVLLLLQPSPQPCHGTD